jgi:hypothetical protein
MVNHPPLVGQGRYNAICTCVQPGKAPAKIAGKDTLPIEATAEVRWNNCQEDNERSLTAAPVIEMSPPPDRLFCVYSEVKPTKYWRTIQSREG